ncbi:hypothetical protein AAE478_005943 [Parahypoxylon ruwenzoriense]
MATFRFSDLPTELRLEVWEAALRRESERRLVVVDNLTRGIALMKQLVSPFLTVNRESRAAAKAFYTIALDVRLRSHQRSLFGSRRRESSFAGIVHLSADRDLFVKGLGWTTYSLRQNGRAPCFETVCNFETEPLSDDNCRRVQRILAIGRRFPTYPHRYTPYFPTRCLRPPARGEAPNWEPYLGASERFVFEPLSYPYSPDLTVAVILEVGGEGVFTMPQFRDRIRRYAPGQDIPLWEQRISGPRCLKGGGLGNYFYSVE